MLKKSESGDDLMNQTISAKAFIEQQTSHAQQESNPKQPAPFQWGAASASYQIEGAAHEDGRGASIWDVFSHTPGKIWRGHTGDVACDSYHRFAEDLDLLQKLGIPNYRFSLAWSRIQPTGDGAVNPAGWAYYDKIVDGCLERGITPWITLFHWDLPQSLQERFGGWQSREVATRFGQFAGMVATHFYGRVHHYFVLNEPQCFIGLGYGVGEHAPGLQLDDTALFACWHHMLLAYGYGIQAIRAADPTAHVGVASTGRVCCPLIENRTNPTNSADPANPANVAAAEQAMFSLSRWSFTHHMFLDPICLGHYPTTCAETALAEAVAQVPPADWNVIAQKPDFIGLNIYHGEIVKASPTGTPITVPEPVGCPRTAQKWPIVPQSLYYGPLFIWRRYGLPLYITENGCSCNDHPYRDDKEQNSIHDVDRIDFLHRYLLELKRCRADGVPVQGYFHWSLTDNFEWACGYDDRFGLIYVDYATGNRMVKDSARWYSNLICTGGLDTLR